MLVDNLLDKSLEQQSNKRVEADYIEGLNTKSQKPFIKKTDYRISAYIDIEPYLASQSSSLFPLEAKQKSRIKSSQRQRSPRTSQLLIKLSRMYALSKYSKLFRFFDENQYLIPVVIEAHRELKKRFPSEKLLLEVVSDPEAGGCDELFAYILTSLPVEDALQRLNDLDEQWFLNELDRTNGLFNFNLRFI